MHGLIDESMIQYLIALSSTSSVINTTCWCTSLAVVETSSCTRRHRDGDSSADCNNDITRWQHINLVVVVVDISMYCNRGVLIVAVAKL